MADIKTRDAIKGTIKAIDKAAVAGERMKSAYIATKEKAEHSTHAAENSAEEYAADKYEAAADRVTHEGVYQFDKIGRKSVADTRENIAHANEGLRRFQAQRAAKRAERQAQATSPHTPKGASEPAPGTTGGFSEHTVPDTLGRTVGTDFGGTEPMWRAPTQSTPAAPQNAGRKLAESRRKQTIFRRQSIRARPEVERTVKQSARSVGETTVKTASRASAKTAQRTVKTAEQTAKTAIKTSQQAVKTAQRTAQASAKAAKAAKASVHASRAAARTAAQTAKTMAKATAATVKAIVAGVKALVSALIAGGWIACAVIIIICLIGLLFGSVFGIFFSGEDSGTGQSMRTAVQEINTEYDEKLQSIRDGTAHDVLEMSGSRAVWREVLAVYAVKTNTDSENPQEVATMDDTKKQLLSDIFWEMNEVSSHTETSSSTVITETDDGEGNIVQTETTETVTTLYITVSHKTADEMAEQYGFNEEQRRYLAELLKEENNALWSAVLYGIHVADGQIVTVALSQLGNVGGEPFWSWYGFNSRVEWCACFVSWCANECGYIDAGVIPKYAACVNGVQWFKDRGQWLDGSAEPVPGTIIFFDWDDDGGQDGASDHTGIVEKVENGIVYTVEGNSGDSVKQRQYAVGHYEILGYGVPAY